MFTPHRYVSDHPVCLSANPCELSPFANQQCTPCRCPLAVVPKDTVTTNRCYSYTYLITTVSSYVNYIIQVKNIKYIITSQQNPGKRYSNGLTSQLTSVISCLLSTTSSGTLSSMERNLSMAS